MRALSPKAFSGSVTPAATGIRAQSHYSTQAEELDLDELQLKLPNSSNCSSVSYK